MSKTKSATSVELSDAQEAAAEAIVYFRAGFTRLRAELEQCDEDEFLRAEEAFRAVVHESRVLTADFVKALAAKKEAAAVFLRRIEEISREIKQNPDATAALALKIQGMKGTIGRTRARKRVEAKLDAELRKL